MKKSPPSRKTSTPRPPSRREQNKLDKSERIAKAALASFLRDGYDDTTVAKVATRAGVAKGTVFLYAADKDDLLCMVMHDRLRAAVDEAFSTLPRKAHVRDQLLYLFARFFCMYAEHKPLSVRFIQVLSVARGPNGKRINAITFAFQHQLSELLRDASERGELSRALPFPLAAQNIFSLYFGALTAWLNGYVEAPERALELLGQSIDLAITGMR